MSQSLIEAYNSIYIEENKKRATDPAAREAAAKRIEGLKKNPKDNAYVKDKKDPKDNAYVKDKKDPWMSIPSDARQIAQMDAYYELEAKRKKTNEELVLDYLLDEGYVDNVDAGTVFLNHMNPEWMDFILSEMRKQDKVAGKKSGGSTDPAYREVKKFMRGMSGTPKGQQKKVPGQKPPKAGEYGSERKSPAQIVKSNRARRQEGERNMSSRFD